MWSESETRSLIRTMALMLVMGGMVLGVALLLGIWLAYRLVT